MWATALLSQPLGQAVLLLTPRVPCSLLSLSLCPNTWQKQYFALAVREYSLPWERRQSSCSGAVQGPDSCNGAYLQLGGSGNGARTRNRTLHCGQCLLAGSVSQRFHMFSTRKKMSKYMSVRDTSEPYYNRSMSSPTIKPWYDCFTYMTSAYDS